MAEPLSLAAGAISLVTYATNILHVVSKFRTSAKKEPIESLEISIYIGILKEVAVSTLSTSPETQDAVEAGVQLCHERLDLLRTALDSKGNQFGSKGVEKAVHEFIRSVNILRDVVMDTTTHRLLQDLRAHQQSHFEMFLQIRREVELVKQGLRLDSEQHHTVFGDLSDRLNSIIEKEASNTTHWRPDTTDQFSFSATILSPRAEDSENPVVRGKFDTACDDNWISTEVLDRAGGDNHFENIEIERSYIAFGGQELKPLGKIDVTWYAENAGKSRKTTFLAHPEVPFDMVLGSVFIAEESIFMFNKPVLALRMSKFTKDDYRIIEENARQKGATNDQLSTIRRAEEATARDRLRQQKARSTVTSSVNQSLGAQSTMSRGPSPMPSPDTVGPSRQTTSGLEGLSRNITVQSIESEQTV